MWKNPWLVLEERMKFFEKWVDEVKLFDNPYPVVLWTLESSRGHQYLQQVHKDLRKIWEENRAVNKPLSKPFGQLLIRLAEDMERQRSYYLLPSLYSAFIELRGMDEIFTISTGIIIQSLTLLVGAESKVLIGTRGGRPAWKQLKHPITQPLSPYDPIFIYGIEDGMRYIDQSDAELMPDREDWIGGLANDFDWPKVDIAEGYELFERAYYNQRYTVHPEGAYVNLRHFGPIKKMVLKIKAPGVFDRNYFDILLQC